MSHLNTIQLTPDILYNGKFYLVHPKPQNPSEKEISKALFIAKFKQTLNEQNKLTKLRFSIVYTGLYIPMFTQNLA